MHVPQPPPRPRATRILFAIPDIRGRWPAAIRAGLAFAIPACALLAAGYERDALLAALGAFAVLYGEKRPYRVRWRVITLAALVLIAAAAAFGLLGHFAGPRPGAVVSLLVVVALVAWASASVFAVNAMRLGPPGPFFFVLTACISSVVTRHGVDVDALVVATCAGALGSLVVGMAPALWRPDGPQTAATLAAIETIDAYLADNQSTDPARRHGVAMSTLNAWTVLHDAAATDTPLAQRLWTSLHQFHVAPPGPLSPPMRRPPVRHRLAAALHRYSHARVTTTRVAITAFVAGAASLAIGLSRPDWAILGTVLVLQLGPDRIRGVVRATHRLAGTIVGLVIFVGLHHLGLTTVWLVVVITALNVLIELTIVGNYGIAVSFITPLAMLMGTPDSDITIPVRDRFLETLLGVGLAVAALLWLLPRAHRHTWARADADVLDNVDHLLDDSAHSPIGSDHMLAVRRDLQWSLLEAEMSATDSAGDEPEWAAQRWRRHIALCRVGYEALDWCYRTDPSSPIAPGIRSTLRTHRAVVHAPEDP
ncbi:FUSC family protein [Gordonia aichiensis]